MRLSKSIIWDSGARYSLREERLSKVHNLIIGLPYFELHGNVMNSPLGKRDYVELSMLIIPDENGVRVFPIEAKVEDVKADMTLFPSERLELNRFPPYLLTLFRDNKVSETQYYRIRQNKNGRKPPFEDLTLFLEPNSSLRNLVLGEYILEQERKKDDLDYLDTKARTKLISWLKSSGLF